MKRVPWKPVFRLAFALAGVGFCVWPKAASAQQPTQAADDVDARLRKLEELNEKLEQQNQKLVEQNEKLEKQNQLIQGEATAPAAVVAADPAAPVKPDAVKKLVDTYLKEKDEKKKADDEKKKAEEEQKKLEKEAAGYEVGSDLNLKTTWKDGFNAETEHKDFRVHLGGNLQTDFALFAPDSNLHNAFPPGTPAAPGPGPGAWNGGVDMRRARLRADGTMYDIIDFVFEYEFAQTQQVTSSGASATTISATGPTDAYIDIKEIPYAGRVRLGHFKEPYSLEDYGTQDKNLTFMERSSASDAFSPNRNYGVMVWNDPFCQRLVYAFGAFKENTNTNIGNAFDYSTGAYAYTGRLGFNPWYENDGACVLFFGGAYSYRTFDDSSALDRYRYATRIPIRVGSPVLLDTTSLAATNTQLFNLQGVLVYGPFSLQAEGYASQGQGVVRGSAANGVPRELDPELKGAYLQASLFLTGEHRVYQRETGSFGRVRPLEPFYFVPRCGLGSGLGSCFGRGAWEVALRLDYLDLNSAAFGAFPAVKGVSGSAVTAIPSAGYERDVLLGLNWYLNPNVKFQWNYTHAARDVAAPSLSGDVDAFAMRLAFDF